jgi:chromosome segregation ATPase
MKNRLNYLIVFFITTAMLSCVPQRKLQEEQAKREKCEKDLAALKVSNQECETKLNETSKNLADNLKKVSELQKDTAIAGSSYRNLVSKHANLNSINEQLLERYNRLLEGNVADTKKLSGELQYTQERLLRCAYS